MLEGGVDGASPDADDELGGVPGEQVGLPSARSGEPGVRQAVRGQRSRGGPPVAARAVGDVRDPTSRHAGAPQAAAADVVVELDDGRGARRCTRRSC
jgi:hypothetical protein